MTSPDSSLVIWGWPGPNASAGIQEADNGHHVLSIFLDPANLIVVSAPFPNGELLTARFYRALARASAQLSAELDPRGGTVATHRRSPCRLG
jgi:hypothetical protein